MSPPGGPEILPLSRARDQITPIRRTTPEGGTKRISEIA